MKKLADYEDFINFTIDLLRPFKVRFMIIIALEAMSFITLFTTVRTRIIY